MKTDREGPELYLFFFFFKPNISTPLVIYDILPGFLNSRLFVLLLVWFSVFSLTETSDHETRPKILYSSLSYSKS